MNIRILRRQKGWTQRTLSSVSGVPLGTLRDYEQGKDGGRKIETLMRLAKALDAPMEEFLKDRFSKAE